jgi:hypothetical protein
LLSGQHVWPGPPHVAQTEDDDVPEHTNPLAVQMVVVEPLGVAGVV